MMPAQRNGKNRSRQICGIVFKLEFEHIVCEFDGKVIKLTLFQVAIKSSNGDIRFWNNHCKFFVYSILRRVKTFCGVISIGFWSYHCKKAVHFALFSFIHVEACAVLP